MLQDLIIDYLREVLDVKDKVWEGTDENGEVNKLLPLYVEECLGFSWEEHKEGT